MARFWAAVAILAVRIGVLCRGGYVLVSSISISCVYFASIKEEN